MSEEMTIYQAQEGVPMGLEGFTPRNTIGQLKRDNDTGEIEYTQNGERQVEWNVIFTNAWYERALFTGGFGEDAKPDCKSTTRTLNEAELVGDVHGHCSMCDFNQWTEDENGKRVPPKCGLTLAMAGFLDSGRTQPFIVRFRGRALKDAKTILQNHYDMKRALFEISYVIKLGEKQKKGAIMWRDWIVEKGIDLVKENRALTEQLATDYKTSDNHLLPGQDSAEDLATGVSAEDVAEMMGGTIVEEAEVITSSTPDKMPPDFLAATPKEETQEEQVKSGKIPFAS